MKHLLGSIALCAILLGAVPVTAHKAKDSGPVTAPTVDKRSPSAPITLNWSPWTEN